MEYTSNPSGYATIIRQTASILLLYLLRAILYGSEYINVYYISNIIWPDEKFHALEIGLMYSLRLWSLGIGAVIWGYIVDRYSRKKVIAAVVFAAALCMFINALLPDGRDGDVYPFWVGIRIVSALFLSASEPAGMSLGNDIIVKEARSRFSGLQYIAGTLGQLIGAPFGAVLFTTGNWRLFYGTLSCLFIINGFLTVLFQREPERGSQYDELKEVIGGRGPVYDYKLTMETIKKTILNITNILILAEGLFSNLFYGIVDMIVIPYIETPPRNISPTVISVIIILFSAPGGTIGVVVLSKLSDRAGKKNIKNRVKLVIFSIISSMLLIILFFNIPLPELNKEEGQNPVIIFKYPSIFAVGIIILANELVYSLFIINQQPILQEINLPETQGIVKSLGTLLEIISYGTGPLIAGWLLSISGSDYYRILIPMTILVFPGIVMWFIVHGTISHDVKKIKEILRKRAEELKNQK